MKLTIRVYRYHLGICCRFGDECLLRSIPIPIPIPSESIFQYQYQYQYLGNWDFQYQYQYQYRPKHQYLNTNTRYCLCLHRRAFATTDLKVPFTGTHAARVNATPTATVAAAAAPPRVTSGGAASSGRLGCTGPSRTSSAQRGESATRPTGTTASTPWTERCATPLRAWSSSGSQW